MQRNLRDVEQVGNAREDSLKQRLGNMALSQDEWNCSANKETMIIAMPPKRHGRARIFLSAEPGEGRSRRAGSSRCATACSKGSSRVAVLGTVQQGSCVGYSPAG